MAADPSEHVGGFAGRELQPFCAMHARSIGRSPELGDDEQLPAALGSAPRAHAKNIEVEAVNLCAITVTLPPAIDSGHAPFPALKTPLETADEEFDIADDTTAIENP